MKSRTIYMENKTKDLNKKLSDAEKKLKSKLNQLDKLKELRKKAEEIAVAEAELEKLQMKDKSITLAKALDMVRISPKRNLTDREKKRAEELFKIYSHGYAVDKKGNIIE